MRRSFFVTDRDGQVAFRRPQARVPEPQRRRAWNPRPAARPGRVLELEVEELGVAVVRVGFEERLLRGPQPRERRRAGALRQALEPGDLGPAEEEARRFRGK